MPHLVVAGLSLRASRASGAPPYGAVVLAGVAERVPQRLSRLVLLDGFVVHSNESLADVSGLPPMVIAHMQAETDGWRLPPFPYSVLGIDDPHEQRALEGRLLPHPVKCLTDGLALRDPRAAALPRSYIQCTGRPLPILPVSVARARAAGWPFYELPTGHDAMLTAPRELSELLLRLAA